MLNAERNYSLASFDIARSLTGDPLSLIDKAQGRIKAKSDNEFFEVLASNAEVINSETSTVVEQNTAFLALIEAPGRYPSSLVRSMVGTAYGRWALLKASDEEVGLISEEKAKYAISSSSQTYDKKLRDVLPGFSEYSERSSTHLVSLIRNKSGLDMAFDEQFGVAAVTHIAGKNGLNKLMKKFGISNVGAYPIEVLLNQLTDESDEKQEVVILASDEIAALPAQGDFYKQIATLAQDKRRQLKPVIREFSTDGDFMEMLTSVNNPAVGFINGHGNWYSLGKVSAPSLEKAQEHKPLLQKVWRGAGGLTVLSCHGGYMAASPVERTFGPELSKLIGLPVVGSEAEVSDVEFQRRIGKKDTWVTLFHSTPKLGKVVNVIKPKEDMSSNSLFKVDGRTVIKDKPKVLDEDAARLLELRVA